jgi:DNA-binding response OmpR family regulator
MPARLAGCRLLVVEDEALIAAKIARTLVQAGADVIGPIATVQGALDVLADTDTLDGALVDIDLRGQPAFTVCRRLARRRARFMFITGYERTSLPFPWSHALALRKPFVSAQLVAATLEMLAAAPQALIASEEDWPVRIDDDNRAGLIRSGRNLIMASRLLIEEAQALRSLRAAQD